MNMMTVPSKFTGLLMALLAAALVNLVIFEWADTVLHAQGSTPTMLDPDLAVRTVVSGLNQPTSMAFIGKNDFLVLEKATGKVRRVLGGVVQAADVLDLAVNSAGERGLLGIALHPDFPINPAIYLYWTCQAPIPPASAPFEPTLRECADPPATGLDTSEILAVPLLGNRVDRFIWNGASLRFDRNLIKLRAFQNDGSPVPAGQDDPTQGPAANHNGGVLRFGPDRNLYIIMGDNGRRGQLQNLIEGPTPPQPDDQFGGPQPDNAHLSGVILRLNPDGSAPFDNPFFQLGASMRGEVGANIQKIFAYGIRNSFGMAFDPLAETFGSKRTEMIPSTKSIVSKQVPTMVGYK